MAEPTAFENLVAQVQALGERVADNVETVVVGKREAIEIVLAALLCEGHVLLEDVPGVGKTVLAKAFSRSLDLTYRRIQCTPDLLPSDITGVSIYNQAEGGFSFHPGPVFTQVLLADEINRATPRTQAALLEAMEERQVSVEDATRPLPRPFLVLATQNPVELEGTFPLPEAQLDRFMVRVELGYPTEAQERAIARRFARASLLDDLRPVATADDLRRVGALVRQVHVSDPVEEYLVRVVRATRGGAGARLGASPRATLALYHISQALATLRGRAFVIPDDVKALAHPVLAHRVLLAAGGRLRGASSADVVTGALAAVAVPVEQPVG